MTHSNTQSVRNEAESANATTSIPTFEEVYAMPYVQKSIESVITLAIHRYPILASYSDDIRQDILIHLNKDITKFNGRSSIKTFARISIETGLKMAMRRYLTSDNYMLFSSEDIDKVSDRDICAAGYIDADPRTLLEYRELEDAVNAIPDPTIRKIVDMYLDGKSSYAISLAMDIPLSTFYKLYIPRAKKFFQTFFPKKLVFGGRIA